MEVSCAPITRCVLVTGASRGIGRSIGLRSARDGRRVAGCCRNVEAAEKITAELAAQDARCFIDVCDVRDHAVDAFVAVAEHQLGPVDTLVNAAGIVHDSVMPLMSPDQWQEVIETNLTGTWNFCRTYRFIKRRSGVIINLSSVAGVICNAASCITGQVICVDGGLAS